MEVIRLDDSWQQQWDAFIKQYAADGGILQSWQWGIVQKESGHKIFRLAVLNEAGEITAATLVIKYDLPLDYSYLYIPRGPVIAEASFDAQALFTEIKVIAQEEKAFVIRMDPAWVVGSEQYLVDYGFRKCDREIQPKCPLVLDITQPPEAILAGMKQKTRYNINLAQKKGVKIRMSDEPTMIEYFWQLTRQTADRNNFKPHPKEHYKKIFDILAPSDTLRFFVAEYNEKVIAVIMVTFFGTTATYLHGASADVFRDTMAPYALQWAAIQEAQRRGCSAYDFGGVNGATFHHPAWEGITRFKTGFTNQPPREYVGCFESVINPVLFAVYTFVKQIRD